MIWVCVPLCLYSLVLFFFLSHVTSCVVVLSFKTCMKVKGQIMSLFAANVTLNGHLFIHIVNNCIEMQEITFCFVLKELSILGFL